MDVEPGTITISDAAGVRVGRDGDWIIVYTEDGSGYITTIRLTPPQAFDMAKLLNGSAVCAALRARSP